MCSTCSTFFPSGVAPGEESGEAANQFTEVDERLECADLDAAERRKTGQSKLSEPAHCLLCQGVDCGCSGKIRFRRLASSREGFNKAA